MRFLWRSVGVSKETERGWPMTGGGCIVSVSSFPIDAVAESKGAVALEWSGPIDSPAVIGLSGVIISPTSNESDSDGIGVVRVSKSKTPRSVMS